MLELDVLLGNFFEKCFIHLSKKEQDIFVALLDESDADLFIWLTGKQMPEGPASRAMIDKIRQYAKDRHRS
jgi:succinate dehydrogenase flavin-adding protein (antitoxin of CptAB toxin-antitoxin module)